MAERLPRYNLCIVDYRSSSDAGGALPELREKLEASLGDGFTVERELGGGGMSRVFVAVDNRLRRRVVVKVLLPDLAAGVNADRFEREIQFAASLQQANIVPLISAGEMNGLPYFMMPFVDGESLRSRLAKSGPLPITEATGMMRDIARALSYAHSSGVVHRDIKPDNVLLSHGAAVVTDFGIAKALSASRRGQDGGELTRIGTSLGTPSYMSPEQVAGDPNVDHRADLYAFGCLAYELLTGDPPFRGDSPQRVLAAHLSEKPKPIRSIRRDVPEALAMIVMRCLEKEPDARPQSADAVVASLESMKLNAPPSGRIKSRGALFSLATAAILIIAALSLFLRGSPAKAAAPKSVAVLPLANLSGDKANDYFGEGIAEEITGALSKTGLRVIGRSSARSLAAKGLSPAEIASQLGVATVLQGSVQRAGKQLRISVSLISPRDGAILWSEKFDRNISDMFAIQDEIARSVASALRVKLDEGESGKQKRAETADPEAHALYLQGLYLWNRRTGPALLRAIQLFQEAVKRDPGYARPYGGIALAYAALPAYAEVDNDEMFRLGRIAAERALAIDSSIAEAYTAIAYSDVLQYRNTNAEAEFQRAVAADSMYATAHFWHALLLKQERRYDEALKGIRHARSLEPASLVINTAEGQILFAARRYTEAERVLTRVLDLDSTFQLAVVDRSRVLIEEDKPEAAIVALEKTLTVPGVRSAEKFSLLAYAYARAGRKVEARKTVDAAMKLNGSVPSAMSAAAFDALGDRERAVKVFRAAFDGHDLWLAHYSAAAPFDGLRKDPRIAPLMETIQRR